jgi:hypothetical protein
MNPRSLRSSKIGLTNKDCILNNWNQHLTCVSLVPVNLLIVEQISCICRCLDSSTSLYASAGAKSENR